MKVLPKKVKVKSHEGITQEGKSENHLSKTTKSKVTYIEKFKIIVLAGKCLY